MQKKYGVILTFSLFAFLAVLSLGYREEYKYLVRKSQNPSETQSENQSDDTCCRYREPQRKRKNNLII